MLSYLTGAIEFAYFRSIYAMGREDVEFKTSDRVTLRGWFYTSDSASGQVPCLVMSHGFTALKEMDLDAFAEYFVSKLPMGCLVYDNRGFGDSDAAEGEPRKEIIPMTQCSDISDAITYLTSRPGVNPDKIGIWGSSYSGGHVLYVGAVDRRVKVVLSQVPCVSGWDNFHRLVRPDFAVGFNATFASGTTCLSKLFFFQSSLTMTMQTGLRGQKAKNQGWFLWSMPTLSSRRPFLRRTVTSSSRPGRRDLSGKTASPSKRRSAFPVPGWQTLPSASF